MGPPILYKIPMATGTLFWFFYLGFVWIFFAGLAEYLLVVPLCLLGFIYEPAWGLATRINSWVFRMVLACQPWFRARVRIQLPAAVAAHEQGCLVVANHRSHLDVFVLFREITHLRIVAKRMLFFLPLYGHMFFLLRMIPQARGDLSSYFRAMERVGEGLRRGHRVHVFPEMTRCERGATDLGRFHTAPFQAAREAGVPILPIVFSGTDRFWAKGSQRISHSPPAQIESLEPVDPRAFASAEALAEYVRLKITERLQILMAQEASV